MSSLRKNIMLGTAGHVDHGKTALVKLLTGCETDRLREEKQRGLTIELGFAPCRMANERIVGIVDVPGHVDFIRNMVAGAQGIDVVILVVAADDGVMPQTREHLDILTLMGIRHGVVALTKMDLVEPEMLELAIQDVRRLLQGTFLAEALICPLDNLTGRGFEGFFAALNRATDGCVAHDCSGPFRLWIDDVFTVQGFGTVITGIPSQGSVQAGDVFEILPEGTRGRVRRLQVYGADADVGRAGECVALNVADVDHHRIRRGMLLTCPETVQPVSMFEATFRVLAGVPGKLPDYLEVHLHLGTAAMMARVALLASDSVAPGESTLVQIRGAQALPLVPGDRFVVRATPPGSRQGRLTTLGGGQVIGTSDHRLRRKRQWTLGTLAARAECVHDPLAWVEQMLRESTSALGLAELKKACPGQGSDLMRYLRALREQGKALELGEGLWVHRQSVQAIREKLQLTLTRFHAEQPRRAGIDRLALLNAVGGDAGVAAWALAELVQENRLRQDNDVVALTDWKQDETGVDAALCERVEDAFQKAGTAPPTLAEIAQRLGKSERDIEQVIPLLTDRNGLVEIADGHFLHGTALEAARVLVLQLFAQADHFTTMEFRDALGVSRKFAVPILDYFDRTRFTVRQGNQRTPGVEARKRMG